MIRILLAILFPLAVITGIEWMILSHFIEGHGWRSMVTCSYLIIALIGYAGILQRMFARGSRPVERPKLANLLFGFGFIAIVQKGVLFLSLIIAHLVYIILSFFFSLTFPSSLILWVYIASLVPLFAMLYGIIWGKYRFRLERVTLIFPNLPEVFDGLTIVQISDAHSGSWDSFKGVAKGIKLIMDQQPDMIVFTGDLVNANKDEIDPFMDLFASLKAPMGKYAVLGNHDYYGQPRDNNLRPAYFELFFEKYREMGFELLLNESHELQKQGNRIMLVGVENWGSGRYFPKKGDLDLATSACSPDDFCILLSHDPSHWDIKALPHAQCFDLTLSGHTHGMQFGVNLPFFKWSPVQYRYKRWMGLYKEGAQYLYVNRGFGFLAFPGRVGMSPEVTLITLKKK